MADINILLSEIIGTFILLISILATANPVFITAAFLGAITIAKMSGGHINPVVTLVVWLNKAISTQQIPYYITGQLIGAVAAYFVYKKFYN